MAERLRLCTWSPVDHPLRVMPAHLGSKTMREAQGVAKHGCASQEGVSGEQAIHWDDQHR
jgi:hypothetical protein